MQPFPKQKQKGLDPAQRSFWFPPSPSDILAKSIICQQKRLLKHIGLHSESEDINTAACSPADLWNDPNEYDSLSLKLMPLR